jgi:hypothetical protein
MMKTQWRTCVFRFKVSGVCCCRGADSDRTTSFRTGRGSPCSVWVSNPLHSVSLSGGGKDVHDSLRLRRTCIHTDTPERPSR